MACVASLTGSAPPHSVLEQYVGGAGGGGASDDVDSDRSSQQLFGSMQSLQQVFFNTAMEVSCRSCASRIVVIGNHMQVTRHALMVWEK